MESEGSAEDGTTDDSSSSSSNTNGHQGHQVICRAQMLIDQFTDLEVVLDSLEDASIQFLDLYMRESFLSATSLPQIKRLMEAIGSLTQLERLEVSCPYVLSSRSGGETDNNNNNAPRVGYLPISALQLAVSNNHLLTHLLLVNVNLSGSPDEFQAFGAATKGLSRLHCLVFAEVRLKNDHEQGGDNAIAMVDNNNSSSSGIRSPKLSMLDPLVRSLGHLPSLGHVLISGHEDLGTLQPSTLQACLESASLRDLCLGQLSLNARHLQVLKPILSRRGNNIKEIDLQCHLTVEGAHSIALMLQHNTTLEELALRLTKTAFEDDDHHKGSSKRSSSSRHSSSSAVEVLEDGDDSDDDDEDSEDQGRQSTPQVSSEHMRNTVLAEGIAKSKYLTTFELENADLSTSEFLEPFFQMLCDNYSLESVRLKCGTNIGCYCLEQEIDFYMRLNRLGRGHLFQCPHCSDCDATYLSMLDNLKDDPDLSAFYYFLLRKPSLMCVVADANSNSNGRRRRRTTSSTRKSNKSKRQPQHLEQQEVVTRKRKRLYRAVKYNSISYKK